MRANAEETSGVPYKLAFLESRANGVVQLLNYEPSKQG